MKKLLLLSVLMMSSFLSVAQETCSQLSPGAIENGGFLGGETNQSLAVDIPVYEGTTFAINTVKLNLIGSSSYVDIIIRSDNAGLPGDILYSFNNATIVNSVVVGNNFGFDFYQVTVDISSENLVLDAPAGVSRYWMEILSDADGWESDSTVDVGLPGAFANDLTTGNWVVDAEGDYVYELLGECVGEFPVIYCNASAGNCTYESITNVTFANLTNPTDCGPGYNDFTNLVANVTQGDSVQISVTIETDESDYLFVFIDWNQNGILDDEGEYYLVANSVDEAQAYTYDINVPADAVVGQTRMRVFLSWDNPDTTPCSSVSYGEVEDYTVNVQAAASVNDFFAKNISIYPNPTVDVFNLTSTTAVVQNITLTDLNGRVVKNMSVSSLSDTEVNISDLTAGMYFITVQTDLGIGSAKVVKK